MISQLKKKLHRKLSGDSRRNAKNGLVSTLGFLVTFAGLVVTTPLLLKLLGKEAMGVFVLIRTLVGVGGVLSLGMGQATVRFVAKYQALEDSSKVEKIARTTLTFYCLIGLGVGTLLFVSSGFLAGTVFRIPDSLVPEAADAFRVCGLGLLAALLFSGYTSILKGLQRFELSVASEVTTNVLMLGAHIYLLLNGYGLVALTYATIGAQIVGLVLAALLVSRLPTLNIRPLPLWDGPSFRETLGFGLYSWLGSTMNKLRSEAPPLILGVLLGTGEVAIYNIASKVLMQVSRLITSATSYLFPYLTQLYEKRQFEELKKHYYQMSRILVVVSVALMSVMVFSGEVILEAWLGAEEVPLIFWIVQIIAFRFVMLPLGVMNFSFIAATNKMKALLVTQSVACIVTVLGTAIGAYFGGLQGAAFGQLSILLVIVGNRCYIERKLFKVTSLIYQLGLVLAATLPLLSLRYFALSMDSGWGEVAIWTSIAIFGAVVISFGISAVFNKLKQNLPLAVSE